MPIAVVANQKGGVGKTSTVANLAVTWARMGRRVLAVDLDAQTNLTFQLGCALDNELSTADMLDAQLAPVQVRVASPHGPDLLPASERLSALEIGLALAVAGQMRLRQVLDGADGYDWIVVDTPPNLGLLTINGLVAADIVLSPISAEDVGAAQGFARLRQSNASTAPLRQEAPAPIVAMLTRWDERRVVASRMDATLRALDSAPVARIPLRAAVNRSGVDRVPAVVADADGPVADEYRRIANHLDDWARRR